jgi:ABC-2 type transport system ATP-binding protein
LLTPSKASARACLLGPNGAGKSTAIRLLGGAIAPTAGRVRLLGADVRAADAYLAARRRTGIVPQGPGMYADLTVDEYLALARAVYRRGAVAAMIDLFGLGPYRDMPLARLSGGFQRRLTLAAALLSEPDLLLLDEPTVGLDPVATHEVHGYLRQVMAGRTTLLCTHNMAEAEALCDEVVILRGGAVLVQSSLADLRQRARMPVRLAARQGRAALLAALDGLGLAARPDPGDDAAVLLPVADPAADLPDLLRRLLADGQEVYLCQPLQATLEALFLDLVRAG